MLVRGLDAIRVDVGKALLIPCGVPATPTSFASFESVMSDMTLPRELGNTRPLRSRSSAASRSTSIAASDKGTTCSL